MLNSRPTRGPRFFNGRLFVVGALFLTFFFSSYLVLSPAASGTKVYVLTAGLDAGATVNFSTDTTVETLPGSSLSKNFIDEVEAARITALGSNAILLNSLAAGDYLRDSDIYWPKVDEAGQPLPGYEGGRITDLLVGNNRIVSVLGDATTTFARSGDRLDIYQISGDGGFTQVNLCFSKKILYVVPRLIPSGAEANGFTPGGTSFILDLGSDASGLTPDLLAAALIRLQESGKIRVALGSPTSAPATGSCPDIFPAVVAPTPDASASPAPSITPAPSTPPVPSPAP